MINFEELALTHYNEFLKNVEEADPRLYNDFKSGKTDLKDTLFSTYVGNKVIITTYNMLRMGVQV